MTQNVTIRENQFTLHPAGVVYWHQRKMLLISDVHLGKINHFRKFGAAVPHNALYGNYELMDGVVDYFQPDQICFLGDLFHSSINMEWPVFSRWVSQLPARVVLVSGNHDIISPVRYEGLGIKTVPELRLAPFLLTHYPTLEPGYFNFSGHVHPAIKLRGNGRQSLRLPCFFKTPDQMILPAFGKFTGTHTLQPGEKDEVYAIAKNEVVYIP